jgi:hypothetical protein
MSGDKARAKFSWSGIWNWQKGEATILAVRKDLVS